MATLRVRALPCEGHTYFRRAGLCFVVGQEVTIQADAEVEAALRAETTRLRVELVEFVEPSPAAEPERAPEPHLEEGAPSEETSAVEVQAEAAPAAPPPRGGTSRKKKGRG